MEILLIQPWQEEDRSFRTRMSGLITYAPLTLPQLAAYVPQDIAVTIYDERLKKYTHDPKKHYDIVAITVLTPTAKRAYELADELRARGSFVVLGGYHVSALPDEAKAHADSIIIGAGDYAFPRLIADYRAGRAAERYDMQGISGCDILPPRRELIPMSGYLRYPALIANRGCKNACEYCAISRMWRGCSARPVQDVIAEIKSLKAKIIVFLDPNFFSSREYSIELMTALSELKIRWAGSATIDTAFDSELMRLAKKSGCKGLLVGLESLSRKALEGTGKHFNDPNRYKEAIAIMQSYGISVNGCFILGLDGDTEQLLLSLPEQVKYLNLNLTRFAILTPVPNSPLFNRLEREGRIISRDWSVYTQHRAVFTPSDMSPERLEQIYKQVWKESYSYKNLIYRAMHLPGGFLEKLICIGANLGFKYFGME